MADAIHTLPRFTDEDAAREHLESILWPSGPVCPHCGGTERNSRLNGKAHRAGLLFCGDCRTQFTVTIGTVFERSKVALHKWVYATHLMCASKKGVSAKQMERMLGVSYKTAWFMAHRIREAMNIEPTGQMGGDGGPVEVDETYWGNVGKQKPGARGGDHKMKIVSLVDRESGEKRSFHVADVTAKTLKPIMQKHISAQAALMTDEAKVYNKIGQEFASHDSVNHSANEYVNPIRPWITTNTVEGSFALLKRGLTGTFHSVSEQHLQRYATEFDYRWNTRIANGFDDTQRAA
ncbi:MAG: IS1595 family transposase, partial [Rubrivivax sp.]|nr:IS1595 family transposase [Rubrivivax sp.]